MAGQCGPYIVDTAVRWRHLVVTYSNSQSQLEDPTSCIPSALSSHIRGTSLTLHQPVSSWRAGIYLPQHSQYLALSKCLINE